MKINVNIPSPLEKMRLWGQTIYIKREDLIHPLLSGNKYRKLKYNILQLKDDGIKNVISFGGAYSNHLHALAFTCKMYGLYFTAFIRGEKVSNPTIDFMRACGSTINFVSRSDFKDLKQLSEHPDYPEHAVIPEGGSNKLALRGIEEMMEEIQIDNAQYFVSFGSGATSIGMLSALDQKEDLHVFSALKLPSFANYFKEKCDAFGVEPSSKKLHLHANHHFGGYAKWNEELIDFINDFPIPLDPIYTGKLFFGVRSLVQEKGIDLDRPMIIIHTGGLQGVSGFNQRFRSVIRRSN